MTANTSRRMIAALQLSLDGFATGPGGAVDWVESWASKTPHVVLSTTLAGATWPNARIVTDAAALRDPAWSRASSTTGCSTSCG